MEGLKEKLADVYRSDVEFESVHVDSTGRTRVVVVVGGKRMWTQLAKLVLEAELGRPLVKGETVDHIDGDCTNDSVSNLRVMSLAENAADSAMHLKEQNFICPTCEAKFVLGGRKLRDAVHNRKQGKAGPFCGRVCSGRYSALVGHGLTEEIPGAIIHRSYINRKGQTKIRYAAVGELVDPIDLGSIAERRVGSSPTSGTKLRC